MEKILSLHIGHDASAMYVDHKSLISISEERVSRIKNYFGFPRKAIERIFSEKRVNWNQIDKLIITTKSIKKSTNYKNYFFFNYKSFDFANEVPLIVRFYSLFKKNKTFHKYLLEYLSQNKFRGKIIYYDHHLCHIASSLATYPINNSYLLSIDGGGDGINWSLYSFKNKNLKLLENSQTFYGLNKNIVHDSPADIYSNTTKFLNFKRLKDEGKIMGMSSNGKKIYLEYFKSLLVFNNGRFFSKFGPQKRNLLQKLKNYFSFFIYGKCYDTIQVNHMKKYFINKNYHKEDIAASLQESCNFTINKFLNYLSKKYRFCNENLLVSGGFFSNVLINQSIKKRSDIKNIYVTPNMGDGGLVLGGIFLSSPDKYKKKYFSKISKNVFLGTDTKINLTENDLKKFKLIKLNNNDLYKFVSQSLIKNKIVGVINGKMEFGPRALGNRSILANPKTMNITNILNKRLNRSDFMPFAPIFLKKDAKKVLHDYKSTDYTSKFMTITYNVKQEFKKKLTNIIHHDNTLRAQIIDKENNTLCYGILSQFSKDSNIPCLINTSFNVHEEPIIMDFKDGIKALDMDVIDIIVSDKTIITKKCPS